MKRLFTLFVIVCILGGNAWAEAVYFQKTLIELSTADLNAAPSLTQGADWGDDVTLSSTNLYSTTDPDGGQACYMFHQNVFWVWFTGDNPINLGHQQWAGSSDWHSPQDKEDFDWVVKVTGNIDILCYERKIDNSHSNDRYFLNHDAAATAWNFTRYGSHIYFKSSDNNEMSGTITVTATNKDFEGKPYTCTYTIKINQDIKSRKWDFYSQHLNPVPPSNWNEVTINGDDKLNGYNVAITSSTDPKDIITETDGLRFVAAANQFGYKDPDNTGATPIDDRYVGLHQGATLIIPHETWKNKGHEAGKTHIRIKMGRFGSTGIRLTVTNGKDALGTPITGTGTYEIGGSAWWGSKGDNHQRGEYHFIVADNENDFSIKVESGGGTWLKLYTIEVYEYDADKIITENSVLGDVYQLLNNGGTLGADGAAGRYYLHYRGKAESTKILASTITTSGNITTNDDANKGFDDLTATAAEGFNSPVHTYTSHVGDFGTFGMQIGCYTHQVTIGETKYQYCTDYADRRQSVGYMESKSYPYTWDFTDIWDYKFIGDRMSGDYHGEGWYKEYGGGLHLWSATDGTNKFGLRLALDAGHDVMYCGGSQLWYGHTIIPEAAGLAFTPVNYDNAYDYSLSLSADGLTFAQENRDWWGWRVTVPAVPAGGAVYIHATKDRSDSFYGVKYYVGASVNNKTNMTPFAAGNVAGTDLKLANQIGGSSDGDNVVYAVCNQESSAQDITLFFNGVTVHKMAVSTDLKAVNKYGWTTESRPHDIDPELTSYMTGQNFKNFLVTGADYSAKRVTMTPIANNTVIPAAGTDLSPESGNGSPNAYIIQNPAGSTVNIVNGGFHLFVPDMHESDVVSEARRKPYVDTSSSLLKAQVTATTSGTKIQPTTTVGGTTYTNYAFTYKHWKLDDEGNKIGDMMDGPQAFYRIAKGGASSTGNQAYLPVESSRAEGARGFYMDFGEDEDPGSHGTAVEAVRNITTDTDIYYSLSGQQMNGKPAKGGIYIHNGKKVVIK